MQKYLILWFGGKEGSIHLYKFYISNQIIENIIQITRLPTHPSILHMSILGKHLLIPFSPSRRYLLINLVGRRKGWSIHLKILNITIQIIGRVTKHLNKSIFMSIWLQHILLLMGKVLSITDDYLIDCGCWWVWVGGGG